MRQPLDSTGKASTYKPSSSDELDIIFWNIPYLKWTAHLHPEIGAASGSIPPDSNAAPSNQIRYVAFDGWRLAEGFARFERTATPDRKDVDRELFPASVTTAYVPLPPSSCLLKDFVIFTNLIIKRKRISPVPLPKQFEGKNIGLC